MKKPYFPVYTQVSEKPTAICEKLPAKVFDYPFFNDAVSLVRPSNSSRKELDLNAESSSEKTESLQLKGFIFHSCGGKILLT